MIIHKIFQLLTPSASSPSSSCPSSSPAASPVAPTGMAALALAPPSSEAETHRDRCQREGSNPAGQVREGVRSEMSQASALSLLLMTESHYTS